MESSKGLKGKIAVITGASAGIGAAIAKALAKEGVLVALGARNEEKLKEVKKQIEDAGGKAIYVVTDVVKREQVRELVAQAEKVLGAVDILINNAGIMPLTFMKNVREDDWDRMIDVNIKGVLNGIAAVLPSMLNRKSGDIVNISSDAGRKVFESGTVYCATKAAVESITKGLRLEIAGSGVRVISIQPGATKTELDPDAIEAGKNFPKMKLLEPEDVANSVVYALSQPRHCAVNEIMIRPEQQTL